MICAFASKTLSIWHYVGNVIVLMNSIVKDIVVKEKIQIGTFSGKVMHVGTCV